MIGCIAYFRHRLACATGPAYHIHVSEIVQQHALPYYICIQGSYGRGVLSISQDCFYKDLTPEQMASIATYNFDHPSAFDFAEILCKLQHLRAGARNSSLTAMHFRTSADLFGPDAPLCTPVYL